MANVGFCCTRNVLVFATVLQSGKGKSDKY